VAWLKLKEFPELRRETIQRILVSSLSFESYIREILFSLQQDLEIEDVKGDKLIIPKLERIERLTKGDIEIDILGIIKKNRVLVGECYFGEKAKPEKAKELEKGIILGGFLIYGLKYCSFFSALSTLNCRASFIIVNFCSLLF